MRGRIKRLLKGNSGFTLIELVIVIGIMGFLVVMIAPRLSGVVSGAVDTVCDSNQVRLQQVLATYTEQNGSLPDGLTNLVVATGAGTWGDPQDTDPDGDAEWLVDDNDRNNGAEVFAADFIHGTRLTPYTLEQPEVDELMEMGITTLYNLNMNGSVGVYNGEDMDWRTGIPTEQTGQRHMQTVTLTENMATLPTVMIIGFDPETEASNYGDIDFNDAFRHPDKIYRIVMGVGADSDLVTSGLITTAGMCPGGLQRNGHFAYNNYNIALPRLAATVDRIPATGGITSVNVTESDSNRQMTYRLNQAQDPWQFTTLCPEGHTVSGSMGDVGKPTL